MPASKRGCKARSQVIAWLKPAFKVTPSRTAKVVLTTHLSIEHFSSAHAKLNPQSMALELRNEVTGIITALTCCTVNGDDSLLSHCMVSQGSEDYRGFAYLSLV